MLLWVLNRQNYRRKYLQQRKKIRKYKTRPVFRQRKNYGEMILINEIYEKDNDLFHRYFRMTSSQFDYLLGRLEPGIARTRQRWIDAITPRQRLAMTLR